MKTTLALALVLAFLAGSAIAADASVSGTFSAEGKVSKLGFVRVANGKKAYSDEPAILFAFTEKNASDAKDLSSDAIAFSHKYGSAITMDIFKNSDGVYEVDESAFHHSGSDKAGGNASGILQLKNVTVANGSISGEVYTKPDTDMFGAKVDVDLKFKVAMPK